MTTKVPYLKWRDGRPRWEPGPTLRRLGWRGEDLKDDKGRWLPVGAAAERAQALNEQARAGTKKPAPVGFTHMRGKRGWVYFLRFADTVKIGYSDKPRRRWDELMTGQSEEPLSFLMVRGTLTQEAALHGVLAAHRMRGEWFRADAPVVKVIAVCAGQGHVILP